MKKNKITFYTIIILISLIVSSIIFLFIASSITRTAYITDFSLQEKNEISYIYSFKIRYYNKIFRNSDIYGVYVKDIDNLPNYISNVVFEKNGSLFGKLDSREELTTESRIKNVNYTLKIKNIFYFYFATLLAILICIMFREKILTKYKTLIKYISESNVCKYLSNTGKPLPIDYILFGVVTALCVFSYIYSDALVTFPKVVNLWNVNQLEFFKEIFEKTGYYAFYPYLSYLIYAVLFFPLWIYSKITGITLYTWLHPNFDINLVEYLYIKIESIKYEIINNYSIILGNTEIIKIFFSGFVVILISILILTFPRKSDSGFNEEKINRCIVWLRFIPTLLAFLLFIFYY